MTLQQDWATDLDEIATIVTLAEQAAEQARAARDALLLELRDIGFSLRECAGLLGMSYQRVQQVERAARAAGWGTMPAQTAADRLQAARDAFQAAKRAQKLREERYAMGYRAETRTFYGERDTPVCDEQEQRVRWAGFYERTPVEL